MKNEEIILEITDVANEGNGVGKYNGIAVFVPFAVTGDVIKVKIVKLNQNHFIPLASPLNNQILLV